MTFTFKMREFFEFERRPGTDTNVVACKIRGVRNPALRQTKSPNILRYRAPPIDDGTRIVRIIGFEFWLSESEILSWLTHFGEVLSEITEEPFDCMENFVRGFSNKYPRVPAELYGKLSHFLMPATSENEPTDQLPDQTQSQSQPDLDSWTVARSKNHRKPQPKSNFPQQPQGGPQQQPKPQQPVQLQQHRVPPTNPIDRPVLKIMLTKGTDGNWLPNPQAAVKPTSLVVGPHDDVGTTVGVVATSVAENVSSFLSGIRASFRTDNVNVHHENLNNGHDYM